VVRIPRTTRTIRNTQLTILPLCPDRQTTSACVSTWPCSEDSTDCTRTGGAHAYLDSGHIYISMHQSQTPTLKAIYSKPRALHSKKTFLWSCILLPVW